MKDYYSRLNGIILGGLITFICPALELSDTNIGIELTLTSDLYLERVDLGYAIGLCIIITFLQKMQSTLAVCILDQKRKVSC